MSIVIRTAAIGAALLAACAHAVLLGPDGRGQALVFPYYTTQAASDGAFNTLLSITNTTRTVKALKVVLREGKAGKWAAEWNVYLAAGDMWTAGLVPDAAGMRLVTADISCTDLPPGGSIPISANMLTFTPDDGLGINVERIREGYIEVFEMAVLTGPAQTYASAEPRNCDLLRALTPMPVAPPTGGIAGSATLINVSAARAFSYDAVALDELASTPYFASAIAEAVTFNASAIEPVSVITFGGNTYRSRWSKPVDAVTAVFMARNIEGEYVLDAGTQSKTDWVFTFPTRRHYVSRTTSATPFRQPLTTNPGVATCEWLYPFQHGRDATHVEPQAEFQPPPPPSSYGCWSVTVVSFRQGAASPVAVSDVFASRNTGGVISGGSNEHGWAYVELPGGTIFSSDTTQFNHATGTVTTPGLTLQGLPVTGFAATTFANGFLDCGGTTCKASYGTTFRLRPRVNETLR